MAKQATQPPVLNSPRPLDVQSMTTEDLRATFLIDKIFDGDKLSWNFTDLDRLAVGGVSPGGAVKLQNFKQTGADFFLQRREMGVINVGAAGVITVDGKAYELENLACLYDAPHDRLKTLHPGVDHRVFFPGDRLEARRALGLDEGAAPLLV